MIRIWLAFLTFCLFLPTGVASEAGPKTLTLATTTSTQDTGLLDALVPRFEKLTGLKVKVVAVGTGEALELGRRGDADVLLVHARSAEDRFMAEGHGAARRDVMYNDFVLAGPKRDPAGIRGAPSAAGAMARIARAGALFVSRGDNSGTHQKELALWKAAGITPGGAWYLRAGAGMGEALRMADEKNAYLLSDRATYLAQQKRLELAILVEGDPALFNPYGVIAVSPRRHPGVNSDGALRFIRFLLTPETQAIIAHFGQEKLGQPLFHLYPKHAQSRAHP